ncbi:MAG TPA: glycosyltransferase family 2 protein [Methylomusa anaerophila]|uniref:Chondroitin synthase n=1 Tax=Methylomusa anaerophila TaxID=1930071 RepID=A0A348AKP2_9FIRM|nr:glycosyltransferase family 2 protein [Methylomusa anaerophila]BBB91640.1 chondroitin synthase [Methylomusa anaerophila]HML88626.1 glycosyltransferase family 2 protein [Methylomusa anaerophila]
MKFSIITPSYNQGEFIERTICSVLNQGIDDLEYIVTDGGSRDQTVDILRRYENRLRWLSEPDKGQTDAINKGIRLSTGDIIAYLNSDDIYYPGALAKVRDYFAAHPAAMILYGDADHIDENDNVIEPYYTEPWDYQRLLDVCFLCQPAVFWRRSLMAAYGLFDENLQYCMDYEYWLRVGAEQPMDYLPERLAGSRLHSRTKTLGMRRKCHEEMVVMIYRKTGRPPIRWLYNLGHVIAEDKGLVRHTAAQEMRFILEVGKVFIREHWRLTGGLPWREMRTIGGWLKNTYGRWRREREKFS